jgi:hypothetical protein
MVVANKFFMSMCLSPSMRKVVPAARCNAGLLVLAQPLLAGWADSTCPSALQGPASFDKLPFVSEMPIPAIHGLCLAGLGDADTTGESIGQAQAGSGGHARLHTGGALFSVGLHLGHASHLGLASLQKCWIGCAGAWGQLPCHRSTGCTSRDRWHPTCHWTRCSAACSSSLPPGQCCCPCSLLC